MNDQNQKPQQEDYTEARPVETEEEKLSVEEEKTNGQPEPVESTEEILRTVRDAASAFARRAAEYVASEEINHKSTEIRRSVSRLAEDAKEGFCKGTAIVMDGAEKLGRKAEKWMNQPQIREAFGELEKAVNRFGDGLGNLFRQVMDQTDPIPKSREEDTEIPDKQGCEEKDVCEEIPVSEEKNGKSGSEACLCEAASEEGTVEKAQESKETEKSSEQIIEEFAQSFSKIVETLCIQFREKAVRKEETLVKKAEDCAEELTEKLENEADDLSEKAEALEEQAAEWAEDFEQKADAAADTLEQKAEELENRGSQITEGLIKGARVLWKNAGNVLEAIGKGFQEAAEAYQEAIHQEETETEFEEEVSQSIPNQEK